MAGSSRRGPALRPTGSKFKVTVVLAAFALLMVLYVNTSIPNPQQQPRQHTQLSHVPQLPRNTNQYAYHGTPSLSASHGSLPQLPRNTNRDNAYQGTPPLSASRTDLKVVQSKVRQLPDAVKYDSGDPRDLSTDRSVHSTDLDELPPINTKPFNGHFVLSQLKWSSGDMIKLPKFLGKEGRERRLQRGKAVTKTLKWDHIGALQKPLLKMMPTADAIRAPNSGNLYARCAVVGNGGGLLQRQQGAEIDAHDAVIRFNGGPVLGFEKYVGSRTTYRLTNFDHFYFYESGAPAVEEAVLQHITNGVALQKLVDYADHRPLRRGGGGGHASTPTMYMLDPEFHYFAFNTFGLGAPSNGFYGTLLANERCQQVTLYGFQKEWRGKKLPYHYYNEIEPNDSQSSRDDNESARYKQWLDATNAYARNCTLTPSCEDPRIDKTANKADDRAGRGRDRFMYGEQFFDAQLELDLQREGIDQTSDHDLAGDDDRETEEHDVHED